MSKVEQPTAGEEGKFHHYSSNVIPWYVRLIWIGFWCFAIYYMVHYMFPMLQRELPLTK